MQSSHQMPKIKPKTAKPTTSNLMKSLTFSRPPRMAPELTQRSSLHLLPTPNAGEAIPDFFEVAKDKGLGARKKHATEEHLGRYVEF